MIPINNIAPYEVLKDGDNIQIIHACGNRVLIGFLDTNTGQDTLAWVDNEFVYPQQDAQKDVDKTDKMPHIRLAYSRELGVIGDVPQDKKESHSWDTRIRSHLRYLSVALLLLVALVGLML